MMYVRVRVCSYLSLESLLLNCPQSQAELALTRVVGPAVQMTKLAPDGAICSYIDHSFYSEVWNLVLLHCLAGSLFQPSTPSSVHFSTIVLRFS